MLRPMNNSLVSDSVQVCEDLPQAITPEEHMHRWKIEYAEFVTAYNHVVETEGLVLDEWRSF